MAKLAAAAQLGEVVVLEELTTLMTLDVICAVAFSRVGRPGRHLPDVKLQGTSLRRSACWHLCSLDGVGG